MKKALLAFFAFMGMFMASSSYAQNCTINNSLTVPGIDPDTLPDGHVGQFYSEDIQFVLPTDTMGYTFLNFHILSISLPIGLNWQCSNNANGCNYDPAVDIHGCVNVYGTPLLPGQYPIDVTVVADLNIVSGYPVTFQSFIEILPGNTVISNNGFSMSNPSGCAPITVGFTNNNPGLLQYSWDFGNGNMSSLENPVPQVYTNPGNYIVEYSAWDNLDTIDVYTMTGLTITAMSNYGGGFPSFENADAYFILKENGTTIFQSAIIGDQDPPVSWTTNLVLNAANTYVLEIWEADDSFGEVLFGADDYMGNHTVMLSGCNGCAAGTSTINYSITHQVIYPTPFVYSVDTVHVYGYPGTPNIVYDSLNHVLYTDSSQYYLQWYYNGSPVAGANNDSLIVQLSGEYSVVAINANGCPAPSADITAVYCGNNYHPNVQLNGAVLSTADTLNNSFQWQYNGIDIPGATNYNYTAPVAGNYTLVITDQYGCSYSSNAMAVPVGIEEGITEQAFVVFPNPATDQVNVQWPSSIVPQQIELCDISGKIIRLLYANSNSISIELNDVPAGLYFINITGDGFRVTKKLIRQ